jgi:hypothetical protein
MHLRTRFMFQRLCRELYVQAFPRSPSVDLPTCRPLCDTDLISLSAYVDCVSCQAGTIFFGLLIDPAHCTYLLCFLTEIDNRSIPLLCFWLHNFTPALNHAIPVSY